MEDRFHTKQTVYGPLLCAASPDLSLLPPPAVGDSGGGGVDTKSPMGTLEPLKTVKTDGTPF